jgi:hypothetical protein
VGNNIFQENGRFLVYSLKIKNSAVHYIFPIQYAVKGKGRSTVQ